MAVIGDAQVLTRRATGAESIAWDPARVAQDIERTRSQPLVSIQLGTTGDTSTPSVGILELTAPSDAILPKPAPQPEDGRPWLILSDWASSRREGVDFATRATKVTSTTVSSVRRLLRALHREDRVSRMPAERREIYERIRGLREEIGPVDFDVVEALREIRKSE